MGKRNYEWKNLHFELEFFDWGKTKVKILLMLF